MPRRAPVLGPIDPTPAALTAEQLAAEGVVSRKEAAAFLRLRTRELDRRRVRDGIPSVKTGKAREFPLTGLKAYLAARLKGDLGVAHQTEFTMPPVAAPPIVPGVPAAPRRARSVWRPGCYAARLGAAYLSVSEDTFRAIARQQRWPRKRVLGKVVYPKALVWQFLEGCPAADGLAANGHRPSGRPSTHVRAYPTDGRRP